MAESLIYNRKSFIKDGHILGNKNLNNELSTSDLYKTADNKVKDFFERQKIAFADVFIFNILFIKVARNFLIINLLFILNILT